MPKNYKTIVVSTKGLRIKGDDTSGELAEVIDTRSNEMVKKDGSYFQLHLRS